MLPLTHVQPVLASGLVLTRIEINPSQAYRITLFTAVSIHAIMREERYVRLVSVGGWSGSYLCAGPIVTTLLKSLSTSVSLATNNQFETPSLSSLVMGFQPPVTDQQKHNVLDSELRSWLCVSLSAIRLLDNTNLLLELLRKH